MSNNNNFSNFSAQGGDGPNSPIFLQEWVAFLTALNTKLNTLFANITGLGKTISGQATMVAGTVTVNVLNGVKTTSIPVVTMQIGATQTGFLQATCSLNSITITSTVNTDAGTVFYLIKL